MDQQRLPSWESALIDDAIRVAEEKLQAEEATGKRRAVQLAREQAYHRLAVAIDRPSKHTGPAGQLQLFGRDPTLFDEEAEDPEGA